MSDYAISLKRTTVLLAALAFMAVLTLANLSSFFGAKADAAQLSNRSLALSSSLGGDVVGNGTPGDETNGSEATHTFDFTLPVDAITEGSILFKYCTTAIGACTAPTGLNMASVTLGTETGFTNDYTLDNTGLEAVDVECTGTNGLDNCIGITTGTPADDDGASVVPFNMVVNPTSEATFFVRLEVYSTATFTTLVHEGTVASAITDGIAITSRVVETLGFSTRGSTPTTDLGSENGSTCSPLASGNGAITLGDPTEGTLSIATAYDAWSAFRLYTNAANGVSVQYAGETLTKGTDTIQEIGGTAADSDLGDEQFGLGIDTTANGGSITNADTTFGGTGQIVLNATYANADGSITDAGDAEFAFVPGATPQEIAESASNDLYVACDTAVVRYIANISPLTPAGTYTTTIVYYAVPEY